MFLLNSTRVEINIDKGIQLVHYNVDIIRAHAGRHYGKPDFVEITGVRDDLPVFKHKFDFVKE